MKAALYARFSTEKQSEASLEDQFRVSERIADREGFEVIARFSDAAVSGGTSTRRRYQALLRAARRREIDAIFAEDSVGYGVNCPSSGASSRSNRAYYACAAYWHGRACSNAITCPALESRLGAGRHPPGSCGPGGNH